jgi:hypothetical protein
MHCRKDSLLNTLECSLQKFLPSCEWKYKDKDNKKHKEEFEVERNWLTVW